MPLHPSHQPEARRALRTVLILVALLPVILLAPLSTPYSGTASYLPLHMALETLAIAVTALVFGVVWSLRRERLPYNALLLACAFLGVGLLDFSHMLSYAGMPDFITPSSPEKAIQFWLSARLLGALALLAIALPGGTRDTPWPTWAVLSTVLALVAALHALFFIYPQVLPRTFVPGQGLTAFKIGFEYALIALNLIAAALLLRRMRQPRSFNASGLFAAACTMAMSEFFFTRYAGVTDACNLAGHVYKVLAYAFLYRAIFVEAVQRPYTLLHDSRRQLAATLDALPDLLLVMDAQGRYLEVHAARAGDLTAPAEQLRGRTVHETLPAKAADTLLAAIAQAREQGSSRGKVIELALGTEKKAWFELSVARKAAQPGEDEHFIIISRNITDRQDAEQTLRKLSLVVEQSPISLVITDLHARIEYVNAAFTRTSGYGAHEALGQNPRILQSGKTPASTYQAMWAQLTQGKPWQGEIINRNKAGQEYVESVLIYPVRDNAGQVTHYLAHKEDITEKKRTAARIQQLSRHDQLTGLPNRSLLHEHFRHATASRQTLAVLWIDLDNFKDVNDSLGHSMGDMLLLEMTRRLRTSLQAQDILSRHAGDDFIALLPASSQHAAAAMAEELLATLSQPVQLAGQEVSCTASIGIALYPTDAEPFEALLHKAETAMYRVKEDGRNSYCFFTPAMQERSARILALGHALKQAQQRGELHLVYQPQMSLVDDRIVGAEALLRWNSPQWGAVSPGEFIPIAEANGLIVAIGEWVLRSVLAQLRAWIDQGLAPVTVAVNLSAVQFNQPDLPELVGRLLEEAGVPPSCLELELTEAMAMKNPEAAAQQMRELNQRGIRLSIDDFGTGYSSLSYLKRFRIHKLKIDQSFVRDIGSDADDQAIATAIVQLAHSLGLSTIAEGVETAEQLACLRYRGCDEIQGYYFSRPLPPAQFEQFVRARAVTSAQV